MEIHTVTATHEHLDPTIVYVTLDGEVIETTPTHPFYVLDTAPWLMAGESRGRWVEADDLQIGDAILQADGETGGVQALRVVDQPQWMYNLTVETAHTFFVGQQQWLVHNQGSTDLPPEFSKALAEAIAWLEARGFKADKAELNRFPTDQRGTKIIGMTTADGRTGYRIEFDARNGAHINVFDGKEKGPHIQFKGDQSTVDKITKGLFGCK